ncbi:unnamed protein product [Amaranthus hypochondriacus]
MRSISNKLLTSKILKKLWLIIIAIIERWIITLPIFSFILKKIQEEVYKRAFVNMILRESSSLGDDMFLGNFGNGELPKGLLREAMPKHVAVILDGTRRWAKKRGFSFIQGYEAGLGTLCIFLDLCRRWKIPIVSLFLFSTENWGRPKGEVDYLMEAYEKTLKYYLVLTSQRYGARVSVIGDKSTLPNSLQEVILKIEQDTKDNTECHIIISTSYSGQNDIVHACQTISKKVKDGLLQPEAITKSLFEQHLQTNVTDVPSPDLIIRTSGEIRLSNYYLWQSAYTELYFTNAFWPDFGEDEFVKALSSFQQRRRRFGKV